MLTKNELAERIAETGAGGKNQIKRILDALADVVADETEAGNKITVPGVCTINWRYLPARKKGELYRKGEMYKGFGGIEEEKQEDSKARKQSIKLISAPAPVLKRIGKDASAQKRAIKKAKK